MALTKVDPSVVNDQVIGRRNMIYNGKMQVCQRHGTGNTQVGWSNAAHFPADRWKLTGSSLGNWAFTIGNRPDLTLPPGFGNAVLLECTTADTSITQGEYIIFQQKFEGNDLQHLAYGTSSAKEITLSFYVNSTSTGTYLAELEQGSYINGQLFTINQANTWERKTITFVGNTAASITNNNALGLALNFWFAAGSTYRGGTFVSNTWRNSYANNTRAAGISNLASSTSNNLYITGVQLEVGDQATSFEHRSLAEELSLCQRYYWQDNLIMRDVVFTLYQATTAYAGIWVTNSMRAAPTATSNLPNFFEKGGDRKSATSALNILETHDSGYLRCQITNLTGATQGSAGLAYFDYLKLDAEL